VARVTHSRPRRPIGGSIAMTPPFESPRRAADPVVTEIVRNGVIAVTEEMKTNLMRTAYNMIIYEALDFTTGLFTPAGETVSIGIGLPTFIRGMAETIRAELRHFGRDGLEPGDILVTNDAYTTGSHLFHMTLTLPIFHKKTLVGFACCMAHWIDIGGQLGNITTDIYSEGLQLPFLKLYKAGKINQDVVDIIRMNVRIPTRAMGDLRAQVTAVKTGERRFLELIERYGRDPVAQSIAVIMDRSEATARANTRTIPDGSYEAESYMDDDGIDIGKPVPIRVKVTVLGEAMTVDLTDVSQQVRGFFNSGITTGLGCTQVAYKCITSPRDYPINDGSFRSLISIVPPGRIVSAVRPAPMRQWMTFPMTIIDTVFKALAPAIPDRVIAGHHADLMSGNIHGINPRNREFFIGGFGPLGGGWGAKRSEDGVSATVCLNDGDTHNAPCEQVETKIPVVVERHALVPDSGGAGKHRGGLGVERQVRMLAPVVYNSQVDRAHCKPWGLEGGLDATGNEIALQRGGTWKTDFPNAKVFLAQLKAGDQYRIRSGGGGGYGPPWERDAEKVREDVRQGYVGADKAASLYGVVIDPATFEIDRAATAERRAQLRDAHSGS
jgi:N-methylhydantoinase B